MLCLHPYNKRQDTGSLLSWFLLMCNGLQHGMDEQVQQHTEHNCWCCVGALPSEHMSLLAAVVAAAAECDVLEVFFHTPC